MENNFKNCRPVLGYSSSSSDDEINNLLNSSQLKKPIPTPRSKHLMNYTENVRLGDQRGVCQ